jgi:hypothetical protein
MALRIRFQHQTDAGLSFSVERLSDGLLYDFDAKTFQAQPKKPTAPLPEDTGLFKGRYKATLDTPAAAWPDGDYTITIHDQSDADTGHACVVAELCTLIHDGDDLTPSLDATATPVAAAILKSISGLLAGTSSPKVPTAP